MVIDINLLREDRGHNPEIIKISEQNRFKGTERVEKVMNLDQKWRNLRSEMDTMNMNKNKISKYIGKLKKTPQITENEGIIDNIELLTINNDQLEKLNFENLRELSFKIDNRIKDLKIELDLTKNKRDEELNEIGNVLHPSVVVSNNEDENNTIRTFGDCTFKKPFSHVDLLTMINGADYTKGSLIAGNRGYFLKGSIVFLAQALIQHSLRKLNEKGYICLYTPFFMKKNIMQEVAQLSQFDEELYKVIAKSHPNENDEDKYLIATSEQTIAAYHRDEWLSCESLPIKYAGISTCFRQEVGSHGRDTTGIFRVHQFEKIEQFVICSPRNNESWTLFDEMIKNSEEFCKDLGISYRVVGIVSGALNNAAAKKYDIEAWFPGSQAFRELVSCSNCTDYQSRRLGIRYGLTKKQNQETEYVHMLNSTMCAVTRVICCLLETHQTDSGINIPECLFPYLPSNMKFIPFIK